MTAPPPASPPPKMSQPTDQERAKAHSLALLFLDRSSRATRDKVAERIAQALADHAATARAEGRAEGRAEQRKRDAAKARAYCMCGLDGCHESIAAAIEKETTNE